MRPDTLDDLIALAERDGKWLYCSYQQLWFSPRQLREHNASGRFRWGVTNWELRDPQEMIDRASIETANAQKQLERLREMVASETAASK